MTGDKPSKTTINKGLEAVTHVSPMPCFVSDIGDKVVTHKFFVGDNVGDKSGDKKPISIYTNRKFSAKLLII